MQVLIAALPLPHRCDAIKARLTEYQVVMQAAKAAGRNPIDDLALTFAFQGSPGTGVTASRNQTASRLSASLITSDYG
jgi:hypothetical protein